MRTTELATLLVAIMAGSFFEGWILAKNKYISNPKPYIENDTIEEYKGRGYTIGFQDGLIWNEHLDELEVAEDELIDAIEHWKENDEEVLRIYPFANRSWGRE
jgi:hypothetical protein